MAKELATITREVGDVKEAFEANGTVRELGLGLLAQLINDVNDALIALDARVALLEDPPE